MRWSISACTAAKRIRSARTWRSSATPWRDEALNKKYGVHRQLLVAKSLRLQCGGGLAYLNEKKFTSRFSPRLEGADGP